MRFYQLILSVDTAVDAADTGEGRREHRGEAAFGGENYLHTAASANMCICVCEDKEEEKNPSPPPTPPVLSNNDREGSFTALFYS